ncbi:hypothetical protein AB0K12_15605 [Nonomuraea sp. NPDC049419]|uniref:hypothetical protein n=1 Tax=Nonomuraea sp. NPDC049419 TaxID=3155772 RepID=UPI003448E98B
MTTRSRSKRKGNLAKYWGFIPFTLLIAALAGWMPEVAPVMILGLAALSSYFFVFGMPVWCGALNRDGTTCRENAYGLLLGCYRRQHKWQKVKMRFARTKWAKLNRGLWTQPRECLATIGAIIAILGGIAAFVPLPWMPK